MQQPIVNLNFAGIAMLPGSAVCWAGVGHTTMHAIAAAICRRRSEPKKQGMAQGS